MEQEEKPENPRLQLPGIHLPDLSLKISLIWERASEIECAFHCLDDRRKSLLAVFHVHTGDRASPLERRVADILGPRIGGVDCDSFYALAVCALRAMSDAGDDEASADDVVRRALAMHAEWLACLKREPNEGRRRFAKWCWPHTPMPSTDNVFWERLRVAQQRYCASARGMPEWMCWWDTRDTASLMLLMSPGHDALTDSGAMVWIHEYCERVLANLQDRHSRYCARGGV